MGEEDDCSHLQEKAFATDERWKEVNLNLILTIVCVVLALLFVMFILDIIDINQL